MKFVLIWAIIGAVSCAMFSGDLADPIIWIAWTIFWPWLLLNEIASFILIKVSVASMAIFMILAIISSVRMAWY